VKKSLVVCLLILTALNVPIFGQAIDKTEYKAIDPFDYKLEEDKTVRSRLIAKYKSVVEFVSEKKDDVTTFYEFISLDKLTTLILRPNPDSKLTPPSPGQTVTIYYTMNKFRTVSVVLDAYEDNRSKDEKGIGVEKSRIVPAPSSFKKSDYKLITPDKYKDEEQDYQDDDDDSDRKYFVILQFESQDGIFITFLNPENSNEKPAFLKKKWHVSRRYPAFKAGQKMTIYFRAKKEINDHLFIDDIVVMN